MLDLQLKIIGRLEVPSSKHVQECCVAHSCIRLCRVLLWHYHNALSVYSVPLFLCYCSRVFTEICRHQGEHLQQLLLNDLCDSLSMWSNICLLRAQICVVY